MFEKVLIANRGEIALRIIRTCKELGVSTVAVHTTVDQDSMHVRMADEAVCVGRPASVNTRESYLSERNIIAACEITGADAIHPGYGFLAENSEFVEKVNEIGIKFIGPSAEHVRLMGDKIEAKSVMRANGVPCVPGVETGLESIDEVHGAARFLGYPVIIKATAGGGGRGMRQVKSPTELEQAYVQARQEAHAGFGDSRVYIEKLVTNGRHIEIQVLGDGRGNSIHFGERDCTIQRRHQKLLEETPSPVIDSRMREEIGEICCKAISSLGYEGAGTVEFLYQSGKFYFIEMNTRLQVEHPITEMVYGVDLVEEQLRIAYGHELTFSQEDLECRGHAIEARINAETVPGFVPCPGRVELFHSPGGLGVRMDSNLYNGYTIPPNYDSLVGKLIVHAVDRSAAIARLERALGELIVHPINTTVPLFQQLIRDERFHASDYNVHWLENWIEEIGEKLRG
ncbi:MAG: acetyl-CoA carboxylase biotin carboxylase subunit [Rhodobacteraceae bacterium]|nr:acetyl-CoA carboxylase biotin carboxylase subunit [Paracoccaceae bacterium]